MGLGRHRSSRHGVPSKRSARASGPGLWLTRHQAAERADVHYNTIRGWEESGLLRTSRKPGVRGVLVSRGDLDKLLAERAGPGVAIPAGVSDEALNALQRRYNELVEALEDLLSQARATRPRGRRKQAAARADTANGTGRAGAPTRGVSKGATARRTGRPKRAPAAPKAATRGAARRRKAASAPTRGHAKRARAAARR